MKRNVCVCVCLYASYISTLSKIAAAQQPLKRELLVKIIKINACPPNLSHLANSHLHFNSHAYFWSINLLLL